MTESSSTAYKVIIKGTLVQKTAFSIGGNSSDDSYIDMSLAKDGKGRYTIRGTGLAGALIATARQLYDNDDLNLITEGTPQHQQEKEKGLSETDKRNLPRLNESVWIFHHAHPLLEPKYSPEIRDNVAIRQKTGAAMDGAKFDTEILPAGTKWQFLMEVDEYREGIDKQAASIALYALQQWQKTCWLGRDVARGLGWMQLEELKVYTLSRSDVLRWPDACEKPLDTLNKLMVCNDINTILEKKPPTKEITPLTGKIIITVGEHDEDTYGLDFLSVGGNNKEQENKPADFSGKQFINEKYIRPLGQQSDKYFEFKRDGKETPPGFSLAVTRQQGDIVPHIPGSSLRGTLRHQLSWLLRKKGETIWEPGGETPTPETEQKQDENDIVLQLFGSTKQSAALLISDANLNQPDWQAAILEMHAEDEFTQGVYGQSKFNHSCLIKGQFEAEYHITVSEYFKFEQAKQAIEQLQKLAESNMIPLGSGQWKGFGWVKWEITMDNDDEKQE